MDTTELKQLIGSTGLSLITLTKMLDTDYRSLLRWVSGDRKPRHPAMLRKALQLIALEQSGIITEKLIERKTTEVKK